MVYNFEMYIMIIIIFAVYLWTRHTNLVQLYSYTSVELIDVCCMNAN